MNMLPDHVTRYNHRRPGLLDAPRVYNPYSKVDILSCLAMIVATSMLVVLGVMLLQV